jgi:hypothetical protein
MRYLQMLMLGACLLLSGCFLSKTPLITPQTADHPLSEGVRLRHVVLCSASPSQQPIGCIGSSKSEEPYWTGTLKNVEGWYLLDYGADPRAGKRKVLVKDIGRNFYIVQEDERFEAKPGALDVLFGQRYAYDLVRIDAKAVYLYGFQCTTADRRWLKDKLLAAIDHDNCIATSIDGLTKIFRERLSAGVKPRDRFDILNPK